MGFSITSNYAGEVVQEIYTRIAAGVEVWTGGYIRNHVGIRKQISLPRWTITNVIQDSADTPNSVGTATHDERTLTRNDWMVYMEFNPNQFYDVWESFGPQGTFNFGELPADKQAEMVNVVLNANNGVNEWLGRNLFQGSTSGTAPNDKFDGFLTKATADGDVNDVAGTTISAANVVAELEKVHDAFGTEALLPVRESASFGIAVSHATLQFYWDAIAAGAAAEANPYFSITGQGPMTYKSKRLIPFVGMADDRMLAGRWASDDSSTFHAAIQFDESDIMIDRVQNNSRLWFIRVDASADTQFPFGQDIVNYE